MTSVLILLVPLLLLSPSHCFYNEQSSDTLRDLVAAEKTRLGSRPPSCHNKCNECHPCMAVQVPTIPSHNRVWPESGGVKPLDYLGSAGNSFPPPLSSRDFLWPTPAVSYVWYQVEITIRSPSHVPLLR